MSFNKAITLTAVTLMIFAIIGATLVGLTHENTIEKIRHNEKLTLLKKLNTILPAASYDNKLLEDTVTLKADYLLGTDSPSTAYIAKKQGQAVAVVLYAVAPNGYNGPIGLLVGIRSDGRLAGVRVIKHRETPGLGDAIEEKKSDWILGFDNRSLDKPASKKWKVKKDGGIFDQFTGATITPRAVVRAIHSSLIYFDKNRDEIFGISETASENDR